MLSNISQLIKCSVELLWFGGTLDCIAVSSAFRRSPFGEVCDVPLCDPCLMNCSSFSTVESILSSLLNWGCFISIVRYTQMVDDCTHPRHGCCPLHRLFFVRQALHATRALTRPKSNSAVCIVSRSMKPLAAAVRFDIWAHLSPTCHQPSTSVRACQMAFFPTKSRERIL